MVGSAFLGLRLTGPPSGQHGRFRPPEPRARQDRVRTGLDSGGHGVWRSLVAHPLWERGAVGSNPATPTEPATSLDSWVHPASAIHPGA